MQAQASEREPRAPSTSARSPFADVIRDALDASVQRLLVADPIARVGKDPEGVHQARVATRRLRCDLRSFAPLLDPAWVTSLRDELRWLGGEIGVAREAEVLLGHLDDRVDAVAAGDRTRRPPDARRRGGRPRRRAGTGARRPAELAVPRSRRPARAGRDRAEDPARQPLSATSHDLARIARRPWKRLARALHGPRARPVRPDAARLAYPGQAGAVRGRGRGRRGRRRSAARVGDGAHPVLQDVLGDHQDAVVAQAWLREHGLGHAPDATRATATPRRTPSGCSRGCSAPTCWRPPTRSRTRGGGRADARCDPGCDRVVVKTEVAAAGGIVTRHGARRDRGGPRAPPEVRRLDLPEGQGRTGRDRRGSRHPRGPRGNRVRVHARRGARHRALRRRPRATEAGAVLDDDRGERRRENPELGSGRRCAGSRRATRPHCSPTNTTRLSPGNSE